VNSVYLINKTWGILLKVPSTLTVLQRHSTSKPQVTKTIPASVSLIFKIMSDLLVFILMKFISFCTFSRDLGSIGIQFSA
jgi:hypothetical protein